MIRHPRLAAALFAGFTLCAAAPLAANAKVVTFDFGGVLNSGGAYSGSVTLDVTGGHATSGSGAFSGLGYTNAPMVLITTATPGNENVSPSYPVGFRANDGTDLFGADTNFPLDAAGGLLFDVGTHTATWGQFPLLNLYEGGALFDGKVGAQEYYVDFASLSVSNLMISSVPEPATWAMMLLGLAGLGAALRISRRNEGAAITAA